VSDLLRITRALASQQRTGALHLRWKMNAPHCAFHVLERIAGNLKEFFDLIRHGNRFQSPLYSRGRSNPTLDYDPVLKERYPA
jgi:hypothetical protein